MNSLVEVFYIKIKVKGYLENTTEKTKETFDTHAIKNKNKITYINDNTSYKIEINDNKIIMIRDNEDFSHKFTFDIDNITKSEYYIKELNTSIDVSIKTIELHQTSKQIKIVYEIIDNENKYIYILDMEWI